MEDRDSKVSRLGPVDLVFARVEFAELADQTIRPCQDRGIIEVRSIPFNKGTGDINTMLACFFQKKLRSPSVGDCFGYGVCLCTGIKGRAGCKGLRQDQQCGAVCTGCFNQTVSFGQIFFNTAVRNAHLDTGNFRGGLNL